MGKDTESEDEKTRLGPLSRDNHEQWFRYEKLKALLGWRNLSQITGQITLRLQLD